MSRLMFLAVILAVFMGGPTNAAVTIDWTDAVGPHSVALQLLPHSPEVWIPQVWYGELNIVTDSLSPIVFTGYGNFADGGTTYPYVKIKQIVLNQTAASWSDFHIGLDGGYFYKKWLLQNGWSVLSQTDFAFDFYADPGSEVNPGQTFLDGVMLLVHPIDQNGDGSFTLTKWPTVIPEVGGAAALLTGLGTLVAHVRRRRA